MDFNLNISKTNTNESSSKSVSNATKRINLWVNSSLSISSTLEDFNEENNEINYNSMHMNSKRQKLNPIEKSETGLKSCSFSSHKSVSNTSNNKKIELKVALKNQANALKGLIKAHENAMKAHEKMIDAINTQANALKSLLKSHSATLRMFKSGNKAQKRFIKVHRSSLKALKTAYASSIKALSVKTSAHKELI